VFIVVNRRGPTCIVLLTNTTCMAWRSCDGDELTASLD
jgi:hypothetical protein